MYILTSDQKSVVDATLYLNKHFGDYECSACGKGGHHTHIFA